jgi:Fe-S oxidoreductase
MCPTFQATRDEKHSTRGRANVLRAAISGKLGENGLTSREVYEVLDLCLSCQACLNECPSTVDMSKLKAEFLHQYYQKHGIPLRNRFFANIELISQLSRPAAPIINFLLSSPAGELVSLLGMDPRRSFPEFQRETFTRWYQKQPQNDKPAEIPEVVLFYDTYLEYNYPWIGQAAVFILEQAGIKPIILKDKPDSGRPAFSKGLLDKASRLAKRNLDLLLPFARQGIPIVGCEPSDVVMLTKEYRDLHPGPESDLVAGVSRMLEDYLLEEIKAGRVEFSFDHKPRKVIYHGHCQQKANFGTDATLDLLRIIPSCSVEEIDAGCCGMAGAFGYEKEHYQLSIEIAEMKLAPAVRAADPETIIAASGTSCREQITHTTGRKALHPLEVFSRSLTEKQ